MPFFELNDELKQRKENIIDKGYNVHCLFCLPGTEITLATELNNNYDYLLALPILKMSHRSRNGYKFDVQEPLIPGYIFIYMLEEYDIFHVRTSRFHYRVLNKDTNKGILDGQDLVYANQILGINGSISVSEAIKVNGRVKIVNGPLKQLEGKIIEYSKRSRNCLIEIDFMSRTIRTWLPFDWIDSNL